LIRVADINVDLHCSNSNLSGICYTAVFTSLFYL